MHLTKTAYRVSLLIVELGLAINGYSQPFLTSGLVAYYPFNGTADDASGNGHNGVVNGITISPNMNQVGITNGALHFGGGSYISVTPTPFNVNSNWTISFWCILDANATGGCYVVSTATYGLNIRHDGNKTGVTNVWWFTFVSSDEGYLGTIPNNPNIWNMLTCVRNGSSCEMFLNDALVASKNVVGPTLDTGALWFGRNQMVAGIGPHDLFGSLSDIRIYNRALSTNEVQQLFANESVPHPCSPHSATAVATLDHGFVVAATITDGGCGYINTPSVLIAGGGGTGATATAVVSNGVVVGINITDAGIGYTSTPTVYISSPPPVAEAQFTFTTNNGTITIMGYIGRDGAVSIPSMINGYPVTSIGDSAFYAHTWVTSVTIPNSVTSIGDSAFYACWSLTNVTIPDSVTSIGHEAFIDCTSLSKVTIGNGVTSIGDRAFISCTGLTSVTMGTNVTRIGAYTFYGCTRLTNVTIPDGITSIGDLGFAYCASLTSVTIPSSLTILGGAVFQACTSLTNVIIAKGIIIISGGTFMGCTSLTNITIPDSVTIILQSAFDGCGSLTTITIPNSVTNIGAGAFFGTGLSRITIPNRVSSIERYTFGSCRSLTNITIPKSVTSIGDSAFAYCSNLTSVTIPNSVISVGSWGFGFCGNLTSIYFEGNAPFLGTDTFEGDTTATFYYLPGTTGWVPGFGTLWTLPYPVILTTSPSFGIQNNTFGFIISWATNIAVVVEASTTLAHPIWSPASTNVLTQGSSYFRDPQWTNYPSRFYRIRSP